MKNIVLYLFLILSAHATSFVQRDFSDFVHSTQNIVKGKVGRVWSDWVDMPDGSKQIYTFSEVRVDEVVKGKIESKTIRVKEIGGEKDGIGFSVSGTAEFISGEDVVLMLKEATVNDAAESTFLISDMMMGKLNVEKNSDGTEYLSGPALNLDVHPHLRTNEEKNKNIIENKKWNMDDLRKIAKEDTKPSSPNGSIGDERGAIKLLSGKALVQKNELQTPNQGLIATQDGEKNWLLYLGVGFALAIAIFLFKRR